MRAIIANEFHIPVKGIGRTPAIKRFTGLLVVWEALAAMEITSELFEGFPTLIASGEAVGQEPGCDDGQSNTDDPGYQIWMKKIEDLPANKKTDILDNALETGHGQ